MPLTNRTKFERDVHRAEGMIHDLEMFAGQLKTSGIGARSEPERHQRDELERFERHLLILRTALDDLEKY